MTWTVSWTQIEINTCIYTDTGTIFLFILLHHVMCLKEHSKNLYRNTQIFPMNETDQESTPLLVCVLVSMYSFWSLAPLTTGSFLSKSLPPFGGPVYNLKRTISKPLWVKPYTVHMPASLCVFSFTDEDWHWVLWYKTWTCLLNLGWQCEWVSAWNNQFSLLISYTVAEDLPLQGQYEYIWPSYMHTVR